MQVNCVCPCCGDRKVIEVDRRMFEKVRCGEMHIQDAFPHLSADDRERVLTGTCPTCWDAMFDQQNEDEAWYEASMEAAING